MNVQGNPAEVLRANLDVLESLIDCLESMVQTLRGKGVDAEADEFVQTIRHHRFQAMLVRGQLTTW